MTTNWQPTCNLEALKFRADFLAKIRTFFAKRNVIEVETPLLCQHTVTDPYIESFHIDDRFLQTSPEYAMKRLLAAGSGPIYQIAKAFRLGEQGHQHNPEFSMLEWYRPGFDYLDLINEIDALLQFLLNTQPADKISYQKLFQEQLQIDPISCTLDDLHDLLNQNNINQREDFDTSLQLLLTHLIEPTLGLERPIFIFDFPASQSALAKLKNKNIAERFEAYYKCQEIANGWTELGDAKEQQQRFLENQQQRKTQHKNIPAIDSRLIHALDSGFPECAGVAMGVDRLMMLAQNTNKISDVISFDWNNA